MFASELETLDRRMALSATVGGRHRKAEGRRLAEIMRPTTDEQALDGWKDQGSFCRLHPAHHVRIDVRISDHAQSTASASVPSTEQQQVSEDTMQPGSATGVHTSAATRCVWIAKRPAG